METIKINEPQPIDCPRCKTKEGYQYLDTFRMAYVSSHEADGKYEMGHYTDGRCLNRGITAYCTNCNERLPFKLKREQGEDVSESH